MILDSLHCLYLDDTEDDIVKYSPWILDAWNTLDTGIPLRLESVGSPQAAVDMLQAAKDPYQLFIADILFGEDGEPLGLTAIDQAR